MARTEARLALRRDLGVLDDYELHLVNEFWNADGCSRTERLLNHMLRLTRREEASSRTIQAIQKLGNKKQAQLYLTAFRFLSPGMWKQFREKMNSIVNKENGVKKMTVKLPWGSMRSVQRGAVSLLRPVL